MLALSLIATVVQPHMHCQDVFEADIVDELCTCSCLVQHVTQLASPTLSRACSAKAKSVLGLYEMERGNVYTGDKMILELNNIVA